MKRQERLQTIAFVLILLVALLADGLLENYPLALGSAVLFGMAGVGGFLVWLSNR